MSDFSSPYAHAARLIDSGLSVQDSLRKVSSDTGQFLSIKDYGAIGDGVVDDTDSIQSAIDNADGRSVFIPSGNYLVSSSLVIDEGIIVYGEGDKSRLLVDVSHTGDVIQISSASATDDNNTGYVLRDFRIKPVSGTPGRYGIGIDIQTQAAYNIEIHRVWIDELGGNAIRTIPNVSPLIDGFFTSVIDNCTLHGGIYLDKAGDSIRITNNTITGPNVGVYVDIVGSGLSDGGAHGLEIRGNNITCDDGALDVRNAWQGCFERNNVEVPTPGTLHNNAAISIDGGGSNPIRGFRIMGNFLSTGVGSDTIHIGDSFSTLVAFNYVSRKAGFHSYKVVSGAVNTVIIQNTEALDEVVGTVLDDAGSGTLWYRTWGGSLELNQNLKLEADEEVLYTDSAGASQSLLSLDTLDDTCKLGFKASSPTGNGHLLMYADGTERMRISPIGTVIVGGGNPLPPAIFQIDSTDKAFMPPRMTTTEKDNIALVQAGCVVYDTDLDKLCIYGAAGWETVTSS